MPRDLTPAEILILPMPDNDAGATTVRGYLIDLLAKVWEEKHLFSGKRPWGSSNWHDMLKIALINANAIAGSLDEDGYLNSDVDSDRANELIATAIQHL